MLSSAWKQLLEHDSRNLSISDLPMTSFTTPATTPQSTRKSIVSKRPMSASRTDTKSGKNGKQYQSTIGDDLSNELFDQKFSITALVLPGAPQKRQSIDSRSANIKIINNSNLSTSNDNFNNSSTLPLVQDTSISRTTKHYGQPSHIATMDIDASGDISFKKKKSIRPSSAPTFSLPKHIPSSLEASTTDFYLRNKPSFGLNRSFGHNVNNSKLQISVTAISVKGRWKVTQPDSLSISHKDCCP
eukprot:NODE_6622_length_863_cov_4.022973_g6025_i0.p1 GENE.NODE_6622_length_863_cov_4.022973_g6025_i0~~NODE_6622_length_863_cov_4.022973_g6025_i0.p1  ORF type:complete len:244 (-),score=26.22 NODE_6622_length_863_cov_4.022973_g6025_i0:132-863(-)